MRIILPRDFAILLPVCFLVATMFFTRLSFGDDAVKENLESKMASLLADHEFGLPTYASEAFLEIESSPDSLRWVQGTAKFSFVLAGEMEFRNADWNLTPIDVAVLIDKKSGLKTIPSIFDFQTCSRSVMTVQGVSYELEKIHAEGYRAQWNATKDLTHRSSCVAIDPMTWPFISTSSLSRVRNPGKSLFRNFFETNLCAKATEIDSRTVRSIWYSKATTSSGHRLAFNNITFKDGLPSQIEALSYQAGFRDISELPDRKKCTVINQVEMSWTLVDDVPFPEKVVARLQNAGIEEVNEMNLTVNLKFFKEGSKKYIALKNIADQAAIDIAKPNEPKEQP
jgi:hypothetical protein